MNSASICTEQTGLSPVSALAVRAQKDKALLPELWDHVYRYVFSVCAHAFNTSDAGTICELDDLIQESYIYFCRAVDKYDPERGAFTTLLTFYVKSAITSATRGGTTRTQNDPVFNAVSIDAPIQEDTDCSIGDIITDDSAIEEYIRLEESDAARFILEQVDKLSSSSDKYLFTEYAYHERNMTELANELGVSTSSVQAHIEKAAHQLRNNPAIREAYPEQYERSKTKISLYARKSFTQFKASGLSIVETIVLRNNK